jgi:hypothetical protein
VQVVYVSDSIKEFVRLCSFHDLNRGAAVDARPTSVEPVVVRNRGHIIIYVLGTVISSQCSFISPTFLVKFAVASES